MQNTLTTCRQVLRVPEDIKGIEKRRGFQPPWYEVVILVCPKCGNKIQLRKNWRGPTPSFGVYCGNKIPVSKVENPVNSPI